MMEKDLQKKKKLFETVFTVIILGLFAAFLVLWLKVDSMIPRYIAGAALLAAALVYKSVDKRFNAKLEENSNEDSEGNA